MTAPAAPLEKAGTILHRVYLQLGSQAPAEYNEAVEALLAAIDADKSGLETLLEYAYGYDNKPHQFWLHAKMAAERIGRTDLVSEFAEWYETPPGFDADNRLEVPE